MTARSLLLLCLMAALSAPAAAQRPARLTVLADSVSPGERVRIAVAVDHGPGQSAVFPDVPAGSSETAPLVSFGDAEAFSVTRLPPVVRGSIRTDSAVYEVAVFAVDTARVGPVPVRLAVGRDTVSAASGVAVVPVRSLIRDGDTTPAPLGPPDDFPGLLPVWIALGALALLIAGIGTWFFVRWKRRARPGAPRAEPFPEATAALDALPAAPAERALGAREALRVYLARRLGLPALESTTDEIVAALAHDARVPDDARDATRRVLALADLVAFAGIAPTPARADAAAVEARTAVGAVEAHLAESERRAAAASSAEPPQPAVIPAEAGIHRPAEQDTNPKDGLAPPSSPTRVPPSRG